MKVRRERQRIFEDQSQSNTITGGLSCHVRSKEYIGLSIDLDNVRTSLHDICLVSK